MFKVDLNGRVNNLKLPKNQAMLPIYEAIVNSIHSVQQNDIKDSYIKVILERDLDDVGGSLIDNSRVLSNVSRIIIEDNGVGFNEENFESFLTSDSRLKVDLGGKGIGRLLWLKAFDSVGIESIYNNGSGANQKRSFNFNLHGENIHNLIVEESKLSPITRVTLNDIKKEYKNSIPKKAETIAFRVVEHIISYFLLQDCPEILLIDGENKLNLLKMYKEMMKSNHTEEKIIIRNQEFIIHHLKLLTTEDVNNKMHYCANRRQVTETNLATKISDLTGRINDGEEQFIYSAFVTSKYFDDRVDSERLGFSILKNNTDTLYEYTDDISFKEIEDTIVGRIGEYLSEYLKPIRNEKKEKINEFINTEAPQYRHLKKYDSKMYEEIQAGLSDDKLELELFKRNQMLNFKMKEDGHKLLKESKEEISNFNDYNAQRNKYLEFVNDIGKSNLAQYIIHRKVILDLFENGMKINSDFKYSKEEFIHSIIFPTKNTSDDLTYEDHNLWLIDEKLAYHKFLSSDVPFSKMNEVESTSNDRPDIMIINKPVTVVNDEMPYSSIVVFELKRPERNDYTPKDNPIDQLRRYAKEILNGQIKDKDGRTIKVSERTPFYLYVICDITNKIEEFAELSNLTRTPDEMGYFGNLNIGKGSAYIEIISFDKLLQDAKNRNKVLFNKLLNQSSERLN